MTIALRWLRGLALLTLLILLGAVCAGEDDEVPNPEEEMQEPPEGRAQAVLNVGGHSGAIHQLVFGAAGKRLYTVGVPGDLHEWDVETGERLHVWRFPSPAGTVALSPDGKQLAVGCGSHTLAKDGKPAAPVWLIDLATGKAHVRGTVAGTDAVRFLVFSPAGDRLVAVSGPTTTIFPLKEESEPVKGPVMGHLFSLAFDPPAGHRLLATRATHEKNPEAVLLFGLDQKSHDSPLLLPKVQGERPMAAWSPRGTSFACIGDGPNPLFHWWKASNKTGRADWGYDHEELLNQLDKEVKGKGEWYSMGIAFRSETEVIGCWEQGSWVRIVRFDLGTKHPKLVPTEISRHARNTGMALSPDGKLLALSTNPAYRILVYDLEKRRETSFGPTVGRPRFVGWTKDSNGLVWGYDLHDKEKRQEALRNGLNLKTLEPIAAEECKEEHTGALPKGWKLEVEGPAEPPPHRRRISHLPKSAKPEPDHARKVFLTRPGEKVRIHLSEAAINFTKAFKDNAGKQRLLVVHNQGHSIAIVDPDTGHAVGKIGGLFWPVYDLEVSPNGKYLVVAGGNQMLSIFSLARPLPGKKTDKPVAPLVLQVMSHRGNWIAWTPQGYYAGTPAGDQLLGWMVVGDQDHLAPFYPARVFEKKFRRPDVIQHLLAEGSVETALKKAADEQGKRLDEERKRLLAEGHEESKVEATLKKAAGEVVARSVEATVEATLPPVVRITSAVPDHKDQRKWVIKAEAESTPGQPVEKLRLLVDGRSLSDDEVKPNIKLGEKTSHAEWIVSKMPSGKVEVKVLARCPDVSGLSPIT